MRLETTEVRLRDRSWCREWVQGQKGNKTRCGEFTTYMPKPRKKKGRGLGQDGHWSSRLWSLMWARLGCGSMTKGQSSRERKSGGTKSQRAEAFY